MVRVATKLILVFLLAAQVLATPVPGGSPAVQPNEKVEESNPVVKDVPKDQDSPVVSEGQTVSESQARNLNNVNTSGEREQALLAKLNTKCSQREVSSCVMLKMVTYINKLLKKSSIQLTEGLEIAQTETVVEEEDVAPEARGMESEPDEEEVSHLIANKLWSFVRSRTLRWNIFPEADVVLSANPNNEGDLNLGVSVRAAKMVEQARKKNQMGPLLAAGIMKLGLIGGVAFKALALLVGKALILSKVAFLLGAILWLKKLFSHQRHVTYEVVAHPHHSHSHGASGDHDHATSYSAGWGRNLDVVPTPVAAPAAAQDMAYRAHVPVAVPVAPKA